MSNVNELTNIIRDEVVTNCQLTTFHALQLKKRKQVSINLRFDNRSLMEFWNPEVAVQYIFDDGLSPVIERIFDCEDGKFKDITEVIFYVNVTPHDIPSQIVFKTTLKDWTEYKEKGRKTSWIAARATLYERMEISADGKVFDFDARRAADVE